MGRWWGGRQALTSFHTPSRDARTLLAPLGHDPPPGRPLSTLLTEYVALRALADPDAWPSTDLVLRRRVLSGGLQPDRWRPWRGYAAMHLWTDQATTTTEERR